MTDHHRFDNTLILWMNDNVRIVFEHPTDKERSETWNGTAKDLCQLLTGRTYPGLGELRSRPDHILVFDEKNRIYQPVPIKEYGRM